MLRIGLTGSIATGKSTVLEHLAARGIPVYSADQAVHELYIRDAVPAIETLFPGVVVDGVVDRQRLSAALAAEPGRIAELEAVVHPLVFEKAMDFLDRSEADGADIAVLEVPLLFETGLRYPLDAVIVTHCADLIQRQRALARPGMTGEKLEMILARQMSQAEKRARGDFAIDTSGSVAQTDAQLDAILARLRAGELGSPDRPVS